MERLSCKLSADEYDRAVRGGLQECGDLALYVKPDATYGGRAGVVITFTVELPDGSCRRVQAVTTVALFEEAAAVMRAWREIGEIR
jgi:hypothetical protein